MSASKSLRAIAADAVPGIFDDLCIRRLADIAKFPPGADVRRFGAGIRAAARVYARDAREPTSNELHAEIAKLHRAAQRRRYEQVAILLKSLSATARVLLNDQGALGLPPAMVLHDVLQREAACASIATLCHIGGGYEEGRRRPTGKRSRTWRWHIYAPELRRHFPKRQAERDFVNWLKLAWLNATGSPPSSTAHHENRGPFALMVQECLRLVGAKHADAVELINELHRRRLRYLRFKALRRRSQKDATTWARGAKNLPKKE